jgi:glycosyltransferase involved in cell wall biosynthesis
MRVGILTVRSRPGEEGGAERFFDGLQRAFVDRGVDADLVAIPGDESTFDAIEETYLSCYDFDAACFDGVISTKAPTYLVRHPNHVCYLVHTIRVFYDMFEATFPEPTAQLLAQRARVHELDTLALAAPRTRQVFAIGHEVAQRLARSSGIDAAVLHPPLGFDRFHAGPCGDYIFLPGRLHRWKRVDLAIEAMRHVRAPLRLLIAGSGEDEPALRALAAGDTRIVFLGRVPDARLVDLYANALAVAFVPVREDYGYVTIEAFRSGKPVVTCADSGEAAMLVEHDCTGLVVPPDAASLGAAFERLHGNPGLVAALGASAAVRERSISWDNVVPALADALGISARRAA